jgi:AraC-like DNA-binding protein
VTHLGCVIVHVSDGSGVAVHREVDAAHNESDARLVVSVVAAGASTSVQDRTIAQLQPGDLVLHSSTKPIRQGADGVAAHSFTLRYADLGMPRSVIEPQLPQRIRADHPLASVVSAYLGAIATVAARLTGPQLHGLEGPTIELVRALVTTGPAGDIRDPLARTLGTRIMEYIHQHLADHALSVAAIARAHGISERYVYVILERLGISFGEWVREQRLSACARALAQPSSTRLTVSAIAYRWGFSDHAHFTRVFRGAYDMSPTEWRRLHAPLSDGVGETT